MELTKKAIDGTITIKDIIDNTIIVSKSLKLKSLTKKAKITPIKKVSKVTTEVEAIIKYF